MIYLIVERKGVHVRTGFLFSVHSTYTTFPHILQISDSMHLSSPFILISFQRCDQLFWEPYSEDPSGKGVEKQYVVKNLAESQPLLAMRKGVVT